MITDCKSPTGITIGLIDSLISISRVLAPRLKGKNINKKVLEALDDLYQDKDLLRILTCGNDNPHIQLNKDDVAFKILKDFSKKLKTDEKRNI